MLIYVSGPYSAPTPEARLANAHAAMRAGTALMHLGHHAIVPHLSHFQDELATEDGCPVAYEHWIAQDLTLIPHCSAIFMLEGWESSNGAKKEWAEAVGHHLKVFYSFAEVPREGVT